MKLLFAILIGLVGVSFVLAYAFLPSDNSVILNESMKITDSITTSVIHHVNEVGNIDSSDTIKATIIHGGN